MGFGVSGDLVRAAISDRGMTLSLLCVLEKVGYAPKLVLEAFIEPRESRRVISGTMAILSGLGGCDDGVRVRSFDEGGRSFSSSPSLTMVMEVVDRVLCDEGLFLRRFSGSLSRSFSFLGLLRSRSGSFLRRLGSTELDIATAGGGVAGGCYCSRAGLGVQEGGIFDVKLAPARLQSVVSWY